jgi:cyclase
MTTASTLVALAGVVLAAAPDNATKPRAGPGPEELAKAQVKVTQVSGSAWMIEGLGGNVGVSVGDDGLLLIDGQYAGMMPKLKAALEKVSPKPVRFLVNTHWHPDHTDANAAWAQAGAIIVAHDNVRKRLSTDQNLPILGAKFSAAPPKAWPVITFDDEIEFHWNGDDLHIVNLPNAHTDGDAVVYFPKADVIHAGDLFFNKAYPIVDYDSGGTLDGLLRAQEKMLAMAGPKTKIIPGHGPLADKAALQSAHDLLLKLRDRIAAMVDQGKSLAEVKAAKPTADVDAQWGNGFVKPDMFVDMAYKAYAAEKQQGKGAQPK